MTCCGAPVHTIELGTSSGLALARCSACGGQVWHRGPEPLPRAEALQLLAGAFASSRRVGRPPVTAPTGPPAAARPAAAPRTSARGGTAASSLPRAAVTLPPAEDAARVVDLNEMTRMLSGWSVLGA